MSLIQKKTHIHSLILEVAGFKLPFKPKQIMDVEDYENLPLRNSIIDEISEKILKTLNIPLIMSSVKQAFSSEMHLFEMMF